MNEFIKIIQQHTNYTLDYWDPEKYNWLEHSWTLAQHCNQYIDIWWDPEKYNWSDSSNELCEYCNEYFHIWWDSDKFNWTESSWALAEYCSKYFHIWWDPEKYNWEHWDSLLDFCIHKIDIWLPEYIVSDPSSHIAKCLTHISTETLKNIQILTTLDGR